MTALLKRRPLRRRRLDALVAGALAAVAGVDAVGE